MKTVSYTLSDEDKIELKKSIAASVRKSNADFEKNPSHYYTQDLTELNKTWLKTAITKACFELFERDGLATITRESDDCYNFGDLCGDSYCPIANPSIDPDLLKKQRRAFQARVRNQGVWFYDLIVLGERADSIGGFVGNDFYGSGYDTDFYNNAWDTLRDNPETNAYITEIMAFFS